MVNKRCRSPKISPFDDEEEEDEYEVENLIDIKYVKGKPLFLVKWKGFPDDDNTWEPEQNLTNLPLFAAKMASMKEAYNGKSKNRKGNKVKPKVMDENTISSQISPKISDKEPEVDDKNDYDYQEPDNKRHSAYSSRKTENNNINNSGQKKVKNDAWVPVLTADGPLNDPPDEAVEVEDLLDYKPKGRKDFYLVRWKGDWEDSWEPRHNLLIVGDLMKKMTELKTRYLQVYGPGDMEDEALVSILSIRITGEATLSAVVVETSRESETKTLLPLQEVRQRWPQQLLDFLLARLRLRPSIEQSSDNSPVQRGVSK
ncbi:heterochromatin protein 1 (HP1) [Babesia microti strain RI]|uniref:Heterochromatin protein 1 (HP1) n=1 Tax=Babesia microti (strain RI) TaxID=1133968 RepID=A0A1N6LY77_BABMR|nr:heterochromatin protein 1 (HP1) [Babesia microti strain RI]SIO73821.1 heterochromatin protein 1 (HP1) [Babesia microti strain RI]|eukprot:XP_021337878.1 heterochromatin protein 1 (HP1) [Babesia microti strain RI]